MVATSAGGTPDTILHGRTGFLTGIHDADALAQHVIRLLTDSGLRQRMAQEGPPFIASRFGLERMVDETLAVYRSILDLGPAAPRSISCAPSPRISHLAA